MCPSIRDRCYHATSRDLSARPHEILGLKIKDIIFKTAGNNQYAEVLVNGKTGTRHLPLIESLPYVKEWLEQHPQRSNSNAYFICSMDRKKVGKQLSRHGLLHIYTKRYRTIYFPKLLNDPSVPIEDRNKIQELLKKPWNLYIISALSSWNILLIKITRKLLNNSWYTCANFELLILMTSTDHSLVLFEALIIYSGKTYKTFLGALLDLKSSVSNFYTHSIGVYLL